MTRLTALFSLVIASLSLVSTVSLAAPESLEIDRIEGGTLYFKSGTTPASLNTQLFGVKSLGALKRTDGKPYLLVTGKPCENCSGENGIYVFAPTGGKPYGFTQPGKILEPKGHSLVYESRAFFGHCLRSRPGDVLVYFQREKIDRRRGLMPSVIVAEATADGLKEQLIERHMPSVNDTARLAKNKSKTCQEIEGRNRVMASHMVDVRKLHNKSATTTDDDDDEAPKENATDRDFAPPAATN